MDEDVHKDPAGFRETWVVEVEDKCITGDYVINHSDH
jgi:hypothetical protein